MQQFIYNDNSFFRFNNLLIDTQREKLKKDIDYQIEHNLCTAVRPYQTYNNMDEVYKDDETWQFLINKIKDCVSTITNKQTKQYMCWANVSKENNAYEKHSHNTDLTAVYYLQSSLPEYGTDIENTIIVPSYQNSVVIFNGALEHQIVNMPEVLAKNNHRYSIVIDFNYV